MFVGQGGDCEGQVGRGEDQKHADHRAFFFFFFGANCRVRQERKYLFEKKEGSSERG